MRNKATDAGLKERFENTKHVYKYFKIKMHFVTEINCLIVESLRRIASEDPLQSDNRAHLHVFRKASNASSYYLPGKYNWTTNWRLTKTRTAMEKETHLHLNVPDLD